MVRFYTIGDCQDEGVAAAAGQADSRLAADGGNPRPPDDLLQSRLPVGRPPQLSQHGYGGARVKRAARRLLSNIRIIYHHFGSKDTFYLAALGA